MTNDGSGKLLYPITLWRVKVHIRSRCAEGVGTEGAALQTCWAGLSRLTTRHNTQPCIGILQQTFDATCGGGTHSTIAVGCAGFGADTVARLGGGNATHALFTTSRGNGLLVVALLLEVIRTQRSRWHADLGALDVFALQTCWTSRARRTAIKHTQFTGAADRRTCRFQARSTGSCRTICISVTSGCAVARFCVGLQANAGFFAAFCGCGCRNFANAAVENVAGGVFGPAYFASRLQIATEGF